MNERRIYGEKAQINETHVRDFYNKRALASASGDVGAVLLGNQNPQALKAKNDFDQKQILSLIGPETRVLDIGCGIGRVAGFILPNCDFYCGVDFSEEMVKTTKRVCQNKGGNYTTYCLSALEAVDQNIDFYGGRFGTIIAAGVFMYVNDQDAQHIFRRLPELLEKHSSVYLSDTVGLQKRLTLRDFPSEALHAEYSAIYRTSEEYLNLYEPLFNAGFHVTKHGFRPNFGETYTDTARYFAVLRR